VLRTSAFVAAIAPGPNCDSRQQVSITLFIHFFDDYECVAGYSPHKKRFLPQTKIEMRLDL
jgi:hypothetical protein